MGSSGIIEREQALLTRSLAGMLVQQTTMPWRGLDASKYSSSKSDEGGGDSITAVTLAM